MIDEASFFCSEDPIFKITTKDGQKIKIWADGRVSGFEEDVIISNGIPSRVGALVAKYKIASQKLEELH
jgi:hypothetical protein